LHRQTRSNRPNSNELQSFNRNWSKTAILGSRLSGRSAGTVAGAWDFERINRRYVRHLKILGERPGGALRNDATAKALLRWAAAESRDCGMAGGGDESRLAGLLPGRILPSDYLGQSRLVGTAGGSAPAFASSYGLAGRDASRSRACGTHVQTRIALCKTLCICNKSSSWARAGMDGPQPRCGWK